MPPKADGAEELKQPVALTREKIEVAQKGNVVIEKNADGEYRDEDDDDDVKNKTGEIGGPGGPEPTRHGNWYRNGCCYDL
ncbi:hypothetical protein SLEP1_g3296 [Rubroshorea leprosula]|uniref:Succinate dehydrogenase assembly factor 4, mitochondrial n=1 Tax=Rubroshorea leprosula TaxID=152421 RepID=A0AAV5HVD2_9ROSI|nr:hypothetical protein SLEP1_g3296 [Rubroshorea leprosula]